jgi:hypothetical protein
MSINSSTEDKWLTLNVDPSTLKVNNHETSYREFKKIYDPKNIAKIAKTIASFANNEGGVIFFGIKDRPREIVGVDESVLPDEQALTTFLSSYFHPEINISSQTESIFGRAIYKLIVQKASKKPVICCKDKKHRNLQGEPETVVLREGAIYYRYRGRSSEIKYVDLQNLLDSDREAYFKSMIENLSLINQVGYTKAAVVDASQMKGSGERAQVYLTNETARNLNWINSGRFSTDPDEAAKAFYVVREVELSQGVEIPVAVDPSFTHPLTKTYLTTTTKLTGERFMAIIWQLGILDNIEYHLTSTHGKNILHKFTTAAQVKILQRFPLDMDSKERKVLIEDAFTTYKRAQKSNF